GPSSDLAGTLAGATGDIAYPCGATGATIWYRFTITGSPEVVYADTFDGGSFDTVLFFASSCSSTTLPTPPTTGELRCDDDEGTAGCTGAASLRSQIRGIFPPGTYFLVVG